ncbi:unnamed protein product, partial [Strongylus vulgaris]
AEGASQRALFALRLGDPVLAAVPAQDLATVSAVVRRHALHLVHVKMFVSVHPLKFKSMNGVTELETITGMKSTINDYHLLVAQNFLSNISLDGTYPTTNLQLFRDRREKASSVKNDAESEVSIYVGEDAPLMGTVSILGKMVRLVSTDDGPADEKCNLGEEKMFELTSLVEDETRRKSDSLDRDNERLQQSAADGSVEELRPFELKDVECIRFDQLSSKLRRTSGMSLSGVAWKSPCKDDRRTSEAPANSSVSFLNIRDDSDQRSLTRITESPSGDGDSYQLEGEDTFRNDYDPMMLDEVASASRTIIRTNGFIGVTKLFATPQVSKATLNQTFAEKFPHIRLTYSKLRSIKKDLWLVSKECDVDEYTLAHAFVYFERIVCKGLISKYNRKFVAAVAFLVAVKLNDYKKPDIVKVLEVACFDILVSKYILLIY